MAVERFFPEGDCLPNKRVDSEGSATSLVVLDHPGQLLNFVVTNLTGTAGYLQVHDAAALPSNGAVPLAVFPLAASSAITSDIVVHCATGIVLAVSTTAGTLTLSANGAIFLAHLRD